jgi:hypothetical protein
MPALRRPRQCDPKVKYVFLRKEISDYSLWTPVAIPAPIPARLEKDHGECCGDKAGSRQPGFLDKRCAADPVRPARLVVTTCAAVER